MKTSMLTEFYTHVHGIDVELEIFHVFTGDCSDAMNVGEHGPAWHGSMHERCRQAGLWSVVRPSPAISP